MSDQTAAELFADDLMRIIGERLELRILGCYESGLQLDLCDRRTGSTFATTMVHLSVTRASVVSPGGKATSVVVDVGFHCG